MEDRAWHEVVMSLTLANATPLGFAVADRKFRRFAEKLKAVNHDFAKANIAILAIFFSNVNVYTTLRSTSNSGSVFSDLNANEDFANRFKLVPTRNGVTRFASQACSQQGNHTEPKLFQFFADEYLPSTATDMGTSGKSDRWNDDDISSMEYTAHQLGIIREEEERFGADYEEAMDLEPDARISEVYLVTDHDCCGTCRPYSVGEFRKYAKENGIRFYVYENGNQLRNGKIDLKLNSVWST
jgi:hypothetical protein